MDTSSTKRKRPAASRFVPVSSHSETYSSITLTSLSAEPAQNAPQPSASEQPVILTLDTANNSVGNREGSPDDLAALITPQGGRSVLEKEPGWSE